ncbi:MAG: N-succinylarginine dihydrolase, partial [Erythrobacter sp.]
MSKLVEINFDGIVGPSHNYAGLSLGNIASADHRGEPSFPRAAALQGLAKMRGNLARLGVQGFLLPLPRPNTPLAERLVLDGSEDPALRAAPWSASSMWTANAATVSPAPDTADGRCHLTPANLVTMLHRAQEWPDTKRQLDLAFADSAHFAVHDPVPPSFGDEGAANHMRLCENHGEAGVEVFVYGRPGGRFPARQHEQASRLVARAHRLDRTRCVFVEQSPEAIDAGAFHNDVVAVANGRVLFAHEQAFAERGRAYDAIRAAFPPLEVVEVPASEVSLEEAIRTYLFNAQLLTLPSGGMALIVPEECRESASVWQYCEALMASNGPIREVIPVDVRQSMANGGGPACLRLRVVCDPASVDSR